MVAVSLKSKSKEKLKITKQEFKQVQIYTCRPGGGGGGGGGGSCGRAPGDVELPSSSTCLCGSEGLDRGPGSRTFSL